MDKQPVGGGDPGTQPHRRPEFPWHELAGEIVVGIPASLIAVFCTLLLVSYLGPQFDVVIINDHVIGGTTDQVVVMAVGSVFGAAAVFCALRCWNRFGQWREERGASGRVAALNRPDQPR
jgi:hypothetical protein